MKRNIRSDFQILKKRAESQLCICGCNEKINLKKSSKKDKTYNEQHYRRIKPSLSDKEHKILREIARDSRFQANKKLCLCGCGEFTDLPSGFVYGHWLTGKNGFSGRYKNKRDKYGYCIKRGPMPSDELIVEAHQSFLTQNNINPQICWACQLTIYIEKCHIIAASSGGENNPENLVLLCPYCHNLQHGFEDKIKNWDLKRQYDWLIMMNNWEWGTISELVDILSVKLSEISTI